MNIKIIICGRGGEGVITLNKTLGIIFTLCNYSVISSETHGMAQRGGSVITSLKIGNYSSPDIMYQSADYLISTNFDEYVNQQCVISTYTIALVNNASIPRLEVSDNVYRLNALKLSMDTFKTAKYINQILTGFFLGIVKFNVNNLNKVIEKYKYINLKAVRLGFDESAKCFK
jgi:indolepyruvate ferredoxin oxidoreductase beta subunit